MYFKVDGKFSDFDLKMLCHILTLLDSSLTELQQQIDASDDPDGMGFCDQGEYLVGTGFMLCQRYLSSTFGCHNVSKDVALSIGPFHKEGRSIVGLINAAANYWKHEIEWPFATLDESTGAVRVRDIDAIDSRAKRTIREIEVVTPWSDYTCANLLYELTASLRLMDLIPIFEDWRQRLNAIR